MLVTKAVVYRETDPSPEERDKKPQVRKALGLSSHVVGWWEGWEGEQHQMPLKATSI